MNDKLPEFVYLITTSREWPVSAIAGNPPGVADWVAAEVRRRAQSANVLHEREVRVWRVPVRDAVEMELLPAEVVKATLREKVPAA